MSWLAEQTEVDEVKTSSGFSNVRQAVAGWPSLAPSCPPTSTCLLACLAATAPRSTLLTSDTQTRPDATALFSPAEPSESSSRPHFALELPDLGPDLALSTSLSTMTRSEDMLSVPAHDLHERAPTPHSVTQRRLDIKPKKHRKCVAAGVGSFTMTMALTSRNASAELLPRCRSSSSASPSAKGPTSTTMGPSTPFQSATARAQSRCA